MDKCTIIQSHKLSFGRRNRKCAKTSNTRAQLLYNCDGKPD